MLRQKVCSGLLVTSSRGPLAGVTLLELLIVVALCSVLAVIAVPAYEQGLLKARRSDAAAGLLDAAMRQEQHLLSTSVYATDMRELGYASSPAPTEHGHYLLRGDTCPGESIAACYRLVATPVESGSQANDLRCTAFFLDSRGRRTAHGSAPQDCW